MAQHDYVIANGTGAAVRSDLNGGLAAIVSQNSGATAPSTTYAYQRWADTTAGVMKMRNGANNAWISLYELDGTFLAGDISLSAGAAATPSLFFTGDTNTGIYSPGADQLAISTGGTVRATVDSSGRFLVGTSTTSGSAAAIQIVQGFTGINNAGCLLLSRTNNTPASDDALGEVVFGDSGHTRAAEIRSVRDGGTWTSGSSQPTRLVFSTTADGAATPTERMRINNAGNLLVGRTGTDGAAVIQAPASSTVPSYGSAAGVSTAITHFEFRNSNGLVGTISTNASATAYNTSSDYRLKENVIPVSDGIVRLQQLKPSRFNFIADSDQTVDGFIAHEVQAVVPECVTGEKDAVDDDGNPIYQGIDQSKLVPLLTAALQEAVAEIKALKDRLTAAGIA